LLREQFCRVTFIEQHSPFIIGVFFVSAFIFVSVAWLRYWKFWKNFLYFVVQILLLTHSVVFFL